MKIRKATNSDIDKCLKIYNDQIEYEQQVGDLTAWRKDIYPDRALVEEAVELQDMYVIEEEGMLLACGRINHILEPHYKYISWQIEEDDENKILVLHTLAVAQEAKRKGVGKMFLDFYEQQAHLQNCTALRFDTVSSNIPAQAFYKKNGYTECGRFSGNYMGRNDIQFVCLEKVISE